MTERLFPVLALASCACVVLAGCSGDSSPVAAEEDQSGINYTRNSAFAGGHLAVFLVLEGGAFRTVHSLTDVVDEGTFETPIPGHEGKALTFLKVDEYGTSMAHGAVSWDPDDPGDYLMAGWWAEFPGQRYPDLSWDGSARYAIVDGPEITQLSRPQFPASGSASYVGRAGGLYAYEADAYVVDEYEGVISLQVDFADRTMAGCIGCLGDLVTRRAHFGAFLGDDLIDTESLVLGHEIHLGALGFDELRGQFYGTEATVAHPELEIVASSGTWGGQISGRPDAAGLPGWWRASATRTFRMRTGARGPSTAPSWR